MSNVNLRLLFSWIIVVYGLILNSCTEKLNDQSNNTLISLNKNELILEIGQEERLVASFESASTQNVAHTWKSSRPEVAIVDETGMVRSVSIGETIITATALSNGGTASCKVTIVKKSIPIESISIDITKATVAVGEKIQLTATIQPENASNQSLVWYSDETEIAEVDSNGLVTTKAVGTAEITAAAADGSKRASCRIKVENKSITLSEITYSSINAVSLKASGKIKSLGMNISECGVCYSDKPGSSINDKKKVSTDKENISVDINNLEINTIYYARLYAICDNQVYYGEEDYSSTLDVEISVPSFSSLNSSSATISGTINSNGATIEESGICYAKYSEPTIESYKKTSSDNNKISLSIKDLEPNTTYYIRLYAIHKDKILYGDEIRFKTLEPLVTNFKISEVWDNKVVLTSIVPEGYGSIKICYGSKPNPKLSDFTAIASGNKNGKVTATLTEKSNTIYVRSYEMNGSTVIYNNDEVMLKTNEIRIFCEWDFNAVNEKNPYKVEATINYEIDVVGTYRVSSDIGKVYKGTESSSSFYISEGSGSFTYWRLAGSNDHYSLADEYVQTNYGRQRWEYLHFWIADYIIISNIETGVIYRFSPPQKIYYRKNRY